MTRITTGTVLTPRTASVYLDESLPTFTLFTVKKGESSPPLGPSPQVVLNTDEPEGSAGRGWEREEGCKKQVPRRVGDAPVASFQLELRRNGGWGRFQTGIRGASPEEPLRAETGSYPLSPLRPSAVGEPGGSEFRRVNPKLGARGGSVRGDVTRQRPPPHPRPATLSFRKHVE